MCVLVYLTHKKKENRKEEKWKKTSERKREMAKKKVTQKLHAPNKTNNLADATMNAKLDKSNCNCSGCNGNVCGRCRGRVTVSVAAAVVVVGTTTQNFAVLTMANTLTENFCHEDKRK